MICLLTVIALMISGSSQAKTVYQLTMKNGEVKKYDKPLHRLLTKHINQFIENNEKGGEKDANYYITLGAVKGVLEPSLKDEHWLVCSADYDKFTATKNYFETELSCVIGIEVEPVIFRHYYHK